MSETTIDFEVLYNWAKGYIDAENIDQHLRALTLSLFDKKEEAHRRAQRAEADLLRIDSIVMKAFDDVAKDLYKPIDQADRYEGALRDVRRIARPGQGGDDRA